MFDNYRHHFSGRHRKIFEKLSSTAALALTQNLGKTYCNANNDGRHEQKEAKTLLDSSINGVASSFDYAQDRFMMRKNAMKFNKIFLSHRGRGI